MIHNCGFREWLKTPPGKRKLLVKFSWKFSKQNGGASLIVFIEHRICRRFWLVCSVCMRSDLATLTVNNHKFHSFPCALFTIQLQHRLHCNKWTIYISRFCAMSCVFNCIPWTSIIIINEWMLWMKRHFPFWLVFGVFVSKMWYTHCYLVISTTENMKPK